MKTNALPLRRVLALPGSLRRDSYNLRLLRAAAERAPAGMRIDVYRDLVDVPLSNEDLEALTPGGPESVRKLRGAVRDADGVLIATPEYNQSMPGVLKNAIDWLSRAGPDEVLAGKPVAIVGITTGRWGTRLAQAALRQTLTATGAAVLPAPALHARNAEKLFSADGVLSDDDTIITLRGVVHALAGWIDRADAAAWYDVA